jgi:hypothetical protein
MAIVLDSSMTLSWLFAYEGDEGSDAVLDRLAVEEAVRLQLPLATKDVRLAKAAGHLGVTVLS